MTSCDAEQVVFREMRKGRNLELSVLRSWEQAPNQRPELMVMQRCKLQQAGVQPLQLTLGHQVEVDTTNPLLRTRALQPTQENLGSTGIRDRALAQTTLDLRITRRLTATARCAG
jgi:hypothetical protein